MKGFMKKPLNPSMARNRLAMPVDIGVSSTHGFATASEY
jgi:hypothetical protein